MIIANAHIQLIYTEGGGRNEKGVPIPVKETIGTKIPCQVEKVSQRNTNTDGEGNAYTTEVYRVLIDVPIASPHRVLLTLNKGMVVFCRTECVESLERVNMVRLTLEKDANQTKQ